MLAEFFRTIPSSSKNGDDDLVIVGFSETYSFSKQILALYRHANVLDMTVSELGIAYKKTYGAPTINNNKLATSASFSTENNNESSCEIKDSIAKDKNNNSKMGEPGVSASACSPIQTNAFPHKKLGFVDASLLFNQGLNLLVSIKKYNSERTVCLNKEFWPLSMTSDVTNTINTPK
jgi:hypothetical protein